ncbi:MAG: transcriptional regulator [Firmicutes bacterium]|nr:transcriptional regulator [Bacillota bacterium]
MDEFYDLAGQFINVRRSMPYVKFDKEVSKKIKHEICILNYLKLHNGIAHPKELSEEFIVSTARMAVLLNQLEEKGYISRIPDSEDSRQTIVKLQPKGVSFFEDINNEILEFIVNFFKELGLHDSREFVRLYTRLMNFVAKKI